MRHFHTHEDETLNALIGKQVSIKMFDGTVYFGRLERGNGWGGEYDLYRIFDNKKMQSIVFRKSHITHINGKRRRR